MVISRLLLIILLAPTLLFSGEFMATVDRNQINPGESVKLTLTLKEASTRGNPTIEPLKDLFIIHSQQQSSNTYIHNGKVSSSYSWIFTLLPQSEGEVVIPSLTIDSSDGILASQPITLRVAKGADSDLENIVLTTGVNKTNPYKNEPFIYTIKLVSQHDLANVKTQKLAIDEAMIEINGDPKVSVKVVDGMKVNVIDISYVVTPFKAGTLKIPSTLIQGVIPIRANPQSYLDQGFDPFMMMQGYSHYKPFGLSTDEVILEVQSPVAEVNPWLPATGLKIEEFWDGSQSLKEGEPLSRGFKISAEGVKANQLLALDDLQSSNQNFKVYADKPEWGDEIKDGMIKSFRKEHYTIIPLQAGSLTLPEVVVTWWDVNNKKKMIEKIPSRTLQILPAQNTPVNNPKSPEEMPITPEVRSSIDPLLLALVVGLILLLIAAVLWGITLQKKIGRMSKPAVKVVLPSTPKVKKPIKSKHETLPDLNPT